MAGKRWTETELNIVKENYYETEKEKLMKLLPGRSWDSIKLCALNKLGLKRSSKFFRESTLEILLNNSNISCYWIGFILADGHISENKRLHITLSHKDKEHLQLFANYIQLKHPLLKSIVKLNNKEFEQYTLSAQNKDVIPKICEIYQIQSNKTYNPPDFSSYSHLSLNQFLSLIIGFVDGDGNIIKLLNREYCNLRIKIHSSWLNNLKFIEEKLYEIFSYPKNSESLTKINKEGYATLCISNYQLIRDLKLFALTNKLPILDRKWDLISLA